MAAKSDITETLAGLGQAINEWAVRAGAGEHRMRDGDISEAEIEQMKTLTDKIHSLTRIEPKLAQK